MYPPSDVGERTKRSMPGPPFSVQANHPTVKCGATNHSFLQKILSLLFSYATLFLDTFTFLITFWFVQKVRVFLFYLFHERLV